MRCARDIIGLPLIDINNGDQVGWVKDVVFDKDKDLVTGFLLEGAHLFNASKGIPRHAIISVGKNALMVSNFSFEEIFGLKWSQKVGNQVYTKDGDVKGTIEDVFLDDKAENIVGFEISDGLFADLMEGREAIFKQHVMVDEKDILIVVDDQVAPWDGSIKGGSLS
ncbi:MAG: PRC-barrel domain-containing protein [Desulfitobacteriaceae bacterium]|nr:PRC-barrel domain-containing protein [Desulfitobacteriaceae bacterium]MDD4345844.1 PRC-barrel domain-containing protein [Desulfitobacteriaceae bacterium]MDD4401306.1 PRC-barrel domain-containing protein [Desulfitobacteriaceae bacterium]